MTARHVARVMCVVLTTWRVMSTTDSVEMLFPSPELATIQSLYQTRTQPSAFVQPPVPNVWDDLKTYRPRTGVYNRPWGRPKGAKATAVCTTRKAVVERPHVGALKDAHRWFQIDELLSLLNTTMKFMHSMEEHTLPPGVSMEDVRGGNYEISNPPSFGPAGVLFQRSIDSLPNYIRLQEGTPVITNSSNDSTIFSKWPYRTRGPWNPWRNRPTPTEPYTKLTTTTTPTPAPTTTPPPTTTPIMNFTMEVMTGPAPPLQPWITDKGKGPIGFLNYPR